MSKYKYVAPNVKITITTAEKVFEFNTINEATVWVDVLNTERKDAIYFETLKEARIDANNYAGEIRGHIDKKMALRMWDERNKHKHVFINGAYIVSFEVEPEVVEKESDIPIY